MKIIFFSRRSLALIMGFLVILLGSGLYYKLAKPSEREWQAEMAKPGLGGKIIIIDPGHGGADPGAMVGDIKEADINMDISLELKKLLEKEGAHVKLTREGDKGFVPEKRMKYSERAAILNLRKEYAEEENAHMLLSIHVNSSSESSAAGAIVFYADEKSRILAQAIQQRISSLDTRKRTIERGNFTIINRNRMPSVLVETGFITNAEDRRRLTEKPAEVAKQVYLGLLDYLEKYKVSPGLEEDIR